MIDSGPHVDCSPFATCGTECDECLTPMCGEGRDRPVPRCHLHPCCGGCDDGHPGCRECKEVAWHLADDQAAERQLDYYMEERA